MMIKALPLLGVMLLRLNGSMGVQAQSPTWLDNVEPMRSKSATSFQFRVSIDNNMEQLDAGVSWAPPDRRCLILSDRADKVPLMIAVDGEVWMYDVIGGRILLIRAEPEFIFRHRSGRLEALYGLRADFPTPDSRTTIDFNPVSILRGLSVEKPKILLLDNEKLRASVKHPDYTAGLSTHPKEATVPVVFRLDSTHGGRPISVSIDSIASGEHPPSWHRSIDHKTLATRVPVLAVADAATFPTATQLQLERVRALVKTGKIYSLRNALRDRKIQETLKATSQVSLDFAEMKSNDEELKKKWIDALKEQGFEFPLPPPRPLPE